MLKLGVQLDRTPALSKACHPQYQRTLLEKYDMYIYYSCNRNNPDTRINVPCSRKSWKQPEYCYGD